MENVQTDILISGAGPAGLTAAITLSQRGFQVLLVDPVKPSQVFDARSTAILKPGRDLMRKAGIWDRFEGHMRPLKTMRIVETTGAKPQRDFRASDLGEEAFGWNVSNMALREVLLSAAHDQDSLTLRWGSKVTRFTGRGERAIVELDDGLRVEAKLALGCDGRNSTLRDLAGITVQRSDIGQSAVVFSCTHDQPHDDVSTELHRSGGPFTLVPLPDLDGQPCSAVVWMTGNKEAHRLADLSEADFSAAATERSDRHFGSLSLCTKRQVWPIISQISDRFTAPRLALAAEAAHVVPPIGAQGLNMSLKDIAWLDAHLGDDPGEAATLAAYEKVRRADARLREHGIGLLNRASASALPPVQKLRGLGLRALHDVAPVRKALMKLGLGV